MRPLIIAAVLILAGCKASQPTRPDPPPTIVQVPVKVYVPVPDDLTEPCPIAKGTLAEIPKVARARRQSLESCNADKAAIRKIQGTPVPVEPTP